MYRSVLLGGLPAGTINVTANSSTFDPLQLLSFGTRRGTCLNGLRAAPDDNEVLRVAALEDSIRISARHELAVVAAIIIGLPLRLSPMLMKQISGSEPAWRGN